MKIEINEETKKKYLENPEETIRAWNTFIMFNLSFLGGALFAFAIKWTWVGIVMTVLATILNIFTFIGNKGIIRTDEE